VVWALALLLLALEAWLRRGRAESKAIDDRGSSHRFTAQEARVA
jgi:hypothetical protein